jgi:hypothetical protein
MYKLNGTFFPQEAQKEKEKRRSLMVNMTFFLCDALNCRQGYFTTFNV